MGYNGPRQRRPAFGNGLIGDDTVTYECGTQYRDEGATAEVTGSVLDFVHHPIKVEISTEGVNIHGSAAHQSTEDSFLIFHN